jgi:hypothetical protein
MKKFTHSAVGLSFGAATKIQPTPGPKFDKELLKHIEKKGNLTEYAAKVLFESNSEAYDKCIASELSAEDTADIMLQVTFKEA